MGVKGIPPLVELPLLDRGKGVVVDEMHGAFLGVAKSILSIWIKEMSVDKVVSLIDKRKSYVAMF